MIAWHECSSPSILAQVPGAVDKVAYKSTYLPCSYSIWAQAVEDLETVLKEVREITRHVILAGDLNLNNMEAGDLHDRSGGGGGDRQRDHRRDQLRTMLASHNLHLHYQPRATYNPYNIAAPCTTLDYYATSEEIYNTHLAEVQEEAAHTTSHQPLWRGPRKRHMAYLRRKWPGWRETAPGQLEALLPDWNTEHSLKTIHETLAPAAKAAAAPSRHRRPTPFDPQERDFQRKRAAVTSREDRRMWASLPHGSAEMAEKVEIRRNNERADGKAQ